MRGGAGGDAEAHEEEEEVVVAMERCVAFPHGRRRRGLRKEVAAVRHAAAPSMREACVGAAARHMAVGGEVRACIHSHWCAREEREIEEGGGERWWPVGGWGRGILGSRGDHKEYL